MKRIASILLSCFLLLSCVCAGNQKLYASAKTEGSRAIAIVFDNSGSMYMDGEQAWCRATYAMEVFASMLNEGDTLWIYPMHPIQVDGKEYTMDDPLKITDSGQASKIRDIYTAEPWGTPIESIDSAAKGLQKEKADKKYMIVLTDGSAFYQDDAEMSSSQTKKQLDSRFQEQIAKKTTVMYLGIGNHVVMPDTKASEYFVKKQAANSSDVLSVLTEMCNQIFGRDTLPGKNVTKKNVEFDISMKKLIVFVQGENLAELKVTGASGEVGKQQSVTATKYATAGCGMYEPIPDTSLQGMMVTYTDCAAGSYQIDYSGSATSVEVYYEPDADLDFVFTDAAGNNVDPNALYEGDYKVSFGMKDAKTGKLIESELLGKPQYRGTYSINEQSQPIESDGFSGEVPVTLNMDDTFDADLTVTYLSGYTITKDSTDFGWPEGGIQVAARPAGELKLEISGGSELYSLQDLDEGEPYIAKVFYQGTQLTGQELEAVELKWEPDTSNANITKKLEDDHYKLILEYKDPEAPQDTVCGECTVAIHAFYTAKGSSQASTQAAMTYDIDDDFSPLQIQVFAPEDYIVISEIDNCQPIRVDMTLEGKKLTEEEFAAVQLQVDCGGIPYTATPLPQESAYEIRLCSGEGIAEGDYLVNVTAQHTDHIGRVTETDDAASLTLSTMPLWVKWVISLLLIIFLIWLIYRIFHILVLPKTVRPQKDECSMTSMGRNVTEGTEFTAKRDGKKLVFKSEYNGDAFGVNLNRIEPGKESYLCKRQNKRSIMVKPENVTKTGELIRADINGVAFITDKEGKLVPEDETQKAFKITNNSLITLEGKLEDAGRTKKFRADIPIVFKK